MKTASHNHPGGEGSLGSSHRHLGVAADAVVGTLTVRAVGEAPPGLPDEGEIEQLAPVGAPAQVNVTDWLNPPAAAMLREYFAVCPEVTVAEADPPEATFKVKSSPEPESSTVWGLPEALWVTERLPDLAPPKVGLKVTEIVQFAPAASALPQVCVSKKSPLAAIVLIASEAGPGLARVAVWAELVVPTNWPPNDKVEGKTVGLVPNSPNAPTPLVVPT